jgi:3-deoxy-7-phosphoheptulonate synthase
MPSYPDLSALNHVESKLKHYPPLVFEGEIIRLKSQLAAVERGEAFLLQGGDCAESFSDLQFETIRDNFRVLLQMAVVLTFGLRRPIVKVGRVAGQFAKPRSTDTETRDGRTLPSYRGDIINGFEFTEASRKVDPARMEHAYFHSAAKLNLLRSLSKGGFADLHKINNWNLRFLTGSEFQSRYDQIAKRIDESISFMRAAGIDVHGSTDLATVEIFTSHEALLLNYEEALTRKSDLDQRYYNGSAHMLWIGDRTRQLDGAHVEFARGIENPIGLKCGPELADDDLIRLIDRLNPANEAGRLTLITRFGSSKIAHLFPKLLSRVKAEGRRVVWCCDPMHGNTFTTARGFKTRSFDDVLHETRDFFRIHEAEGTVAGGVHFELTGRNVTECVGGGQNINESEIIGERYETLCDPRLNPNQALELAFQLVR